MTLRPRKKILLPALGLLVLALGFFFAWDIGWAQDTFGLEPVGEELPLGGQDIRVTVAKIIRAVLGLLGIVALAIALYGGFVYMTAGGNEEKVSTGKKVLINGLIGLAIILSALAIVQFVISRLAGAGGLITVPPPCADPAYANAHKKECDPDYPKWCQQFPDLCCQDDPKNFLAKSITPVTADTKMNNVVARVIFNQPLSGDYEAPDKQREIISLFSGADNITSQFDFNLLGGRRAVEARYQGNEQCADGARCLPGGAYKIAVNPGLQSATGQLITSQTDCGSFPLSAEFAIGQQSLPGLDKVKDIMPPAAGAITINGQSGDNQQLPAGKTYLLESQITDNSGAGYGRLKLEKVLSGGGREPVLEYYSGPPVARGSDAPVDNPYVFSYPFLLAANSIPQTHYILTLEAFDIDDNKAVTETSFTVLPPHCQNNILDADKGETGVDEGGPCGIPVGGGCTEDWQCSSQKCVDGQCAAFPWFISWDPGNGAPGNLITIYGKYFGNEPGQIKFGHDSNGDGQFDDQDQWTSADLSACAGVDTWHDNWVVAQVPEMLASQAAEFDGQDDQFYLSASPLTSIGEGLSVSLWAKPKLKTEKIKILVVEEQNGQGWINKLQGLGYEVVVDTAVETAAKAAEYQPDIVACFKTAWSCAKTGLYKNLYDAGYGIFTEGNDNNSNLYPIASHQHDPGTYLNAGAAEGQHPITVGWSVLPGEKDSSKISILQARPGAYLLARATEKPEAIVSLYLEEPGKGRWYHHQPSSLAPDALLAGAVEFLARQNVFSQGDDYGLFFSGNKLKAFANNNIQSFDWPVGSGWRHLALTMSANKSVVYVDGAVKSQMVLPLAPVVSGAPLIAASRYQGQLDELALWPSVLPPTVIMKQAQAKNNQSAYLQAVWAGLPAGYWRFEEEAGATVGNNSVTGGSTGVYGNGVALGQTGALGSAEEMAVAVRLTTTNGWSVSSKDKHKLDSYFIVNQTVRPGLCSVQTAEGATAAFPATPVSATGVNFGASQGQSQIKFGLAQAGTQSWSDKLIQTFVPNLAAGQVVVRVTVGQENSNGLLFQVLSAEEDLTPIISSLDPSSLTPGSLLTIWGKNFGDVKGKVYLSLEPGGDSCGAPCDLEVNLPAFCGYNWRHNQVVAQVSEEILSFLEKNESVILYLTLKRGDNNLKSAGQEQLTVAPGAPLPGICALQPSSGPAPLPTGETLSIKGFNFDSAPEVYFWTASASTSSLDGWLYTPAPSFSITVENIGEGGTEIKTPIPYDSGYGYSMNSGPIKVRNSSGQLSNGWRYEVIDCRESSATMTTMTGYQCCVEGPEAGRWKPDNIGCLGQAYEAGYVWRFTTGKIFTLPRIAEACDQEAWEGSKILPSPVPWENWKSGKNACLNSVVAVRFTQDMDEKTINNQNIKLYKCPLTSAGEKYCDGEGERVDLSVDKKDLKYASKVLQIRVPPPDLTPNTWYRVAIDRSVKSSSIEEVLGENKQTGFELAAQRPCAQGTAYCYDFKTGSGFCTLLGAWLQPPDYKTDKLGRLQDPRYAYDYTDILNPAHPLYYYIFGQGSQECSILDVDDLGWDWDTDKPAWATAEVAPGDGYENSRGTATALVNTAPDDVIIKAETKTAGQCLASKISCATNADCLPAYNLPFDNPDQIYYIPKGSGFCKTANQYPPNYSASISACYGNADCKNYRECAIIDDCYQGETCRLLNNVPVSNIPKEWQVANECQGKITAASSLIIDLSQPKVVEFFPNCTEACVNANIWARFNQLMAVETYTKDNIKLFQCGDNCSAASPVSGNLWDINTVTSDFFKVEINIDSPYLQPDAFYLVELTDGIRAVGAINKDAQGNIEVVPGVAGKALEPMQWKFKTKNDPSPCTVNNVRVRPADALVKSIGQRTPYLAIPRSAPDSCSPYGQELNPWGYGWQWRTLDTRVAKVTDFSLHLNLNNKDCSVACTRRGADVNYEQKNAPVCGNGEVELGEDCDIGLSNTSNCGYNCLFITKTNQGSSQEFDPTDIGAVLCGDGKIDKPAEDCDIGIAAQKPYCSANCLWKGTQISRNWCEKQKLTDDGLSEDGETACATAVSVCGNNLIEPNEECDFGEEQDLQTCSKLCLWQNICGTANETAQGWKKGKEGYQPGCTLAGSSVNYSTPSLCGDGVVGIGEDLVCEVSASSLADNVLGQAPRQLVESVGQITNSTTMRTKVEAKAVSYGQYKSDGTAEVIPLAASAQAFGQGDYTLQCGYTEYAQEKDGKYNDCVASSISQGVGQNSCCYQRAYRLLKEEYPQDQAGFDGPGVCRNTMIKVKFNKEIDIKSVKDNVLIVEGYEAGEECPAGLQDATTQVSQILAYQTADAPTGWWQKIWQTVKRFFASLLGRESLAVVLSVADIKTWCAGSVKVNSVSALNQFDDVSNTTTTLASIYIDNLLDKDRSYAVVLQSGPDGVADIFGAPIRHPDVDKNQRDDVWVFKTGDEICKLESISVTPDSYLFNKPISSSTFTAKTKSTNGQEIQSIEGVYDWDWSWGPFGHPVFNIPALNTPTNTEQALISVKNLEGGVWAVAQAEVTDDVSEVDSHTGKVFSGLTDLAAMFCEHPWPAYQKDGSWKPFVDEEFNFKLQYCADAGKFGKIDDDLPFFDLFKIDEGTKISTLVPGNCASDQTISCTEDSECPEAKYYIMPFSESWGKPECDRTEYSYSQLVVNKCKLYTFSPEKYCKTDKQYPPIYGSDYRSCSEDSDCDTEIDEKCQGVPLANWQVSGVSGTNKCVGVTNVDEFTPNPTIADDILRRYLLFSDIHDDAIGVQIFAEPPKDANGRRLSLREWYQQNFPQAPMPSSARLAGYEALADGRNYYVSALNWNESGKVYNNIYQFTINQGAQAESKQAFDLLIDSLAFNINLPDFGYCLKDLEFSDSYQPSEVAPLSWLASSYWSNISFSDACQNDFDCRQLDGRPKKDVLGICSNAKTKFLRDWQRLGVLGPLQVKLEAYKAGKGAYPKLEAGTYLPSYTMSLWPSWGRLGSLIGGAPVDLLNRASLCPDPKAESQTCWNAASSTYSCPYFASVYEYDFVSSTQEYKLHLPFEFFTPNHDIVKEFLDTSQLTTERGCQPEQIYSPFGGVCGNGVVNPGEQCDPPGKTYLLGQGWTGGKEGKCEKWPEKLCKSSAGDCGYYLTQEFKHFFNLTKSYCADGGGQPIVNYSASEGKDGPFAMFSCIEDKDCQIPDAYKQSYGVPAQEYKIGPNIVSQAFFQSYFTSNLAKNFKCKADDAEVSYFAPSICQGGGEENVIGNCPSGEKAMAVCQPNCQLAYGSCQRLGVCGDNKIDKPAEFCDDGALNGTYGHCADKNSKYPVNYSDETKADKLVGACQDKHPQYCGNDTVDTNAQGKLLELCEKVDEVYVSFGLEVGKCSNNSSQQCLEDAHCSAALSFSSINDYIQVIDSGLFPLYMDKNKETRNFTISAWVRSNSADSEQVFRPFLYVGDADDESQGAVYLSWRNYDGGVSLTLTNGAEKKELPVGTEIMKRDDKWHQVAAVFVSASSVGGAKVKEIQLYLDGALVASADQALPIFNDNTVIYLGSARGVFSAPFIGALDEVKLYYRNLSASEIKQQYTSGGKEADETNLAAGWHFDEGRGGTVRDYKNNTDSQIAGGAKWLTAQGVSPAVCQDQQTRYTRLVYGDQDWSKKADELGSCLDKQEGDALVCLFAKFVLGIFDQAVSDSGKKRFCSSDYSLLCANNEDCTAAPVKETQKETANVLRSSDFNVNNLTWLNNFSSVVLPLGLGPCNQIGPFGAPYNFYKNLTCSWDCQNYGGYCGDKIKNGNEGCDDGNNFDNDACRNNCTLNISVVCGDSKLDQPAEECDDGNKVKGDGCDPQCKLEPVGKNYCGDGQVDKNLGEVCDTGAGNGLKCEPAYGQSCSYCAADCKKVLTVDSLAYCGNKQIDTVIWKEGTNSLGETIKVPQTYEVCEAETVLECPDKGQYKCDNCVQIVDECVACGTKGAGGSAAKLTLLNPMLGKDSEWGEFGKGMAILARQNPPPAGSIALDVLGYGSISYPVLQMLDSDEKIEASSLCQNEYVAHFNYDKIYEEKKGVEKLTVTLQPFNLGLHWKKMKKYGDLFAYPVNNEYEVNNEIVVSPAVPEGTFRVVIRWTDKEDKQNAKFVGWVYGDGFNKFLQKDITESTVGELVKGYVTAMSAPASDFITVCGNMRLGEDNYWWPATNIYESWTEFSCLFHNSVFVHPLLSKTKTFIQSFTITPDVESNKPLAFFVQNLSGFIGNNLYKNSNLQVEVYDYHQDQIPQYSVYRPRDEMVFSIKGAADTSTYQGAKYWHAFNLVKQNNGQYAVELIKNKKPDGTITGSLANGSIEADFCQVVDNLPDTEQCQSDL